MITIFQRFHNHKFAYWEWYMISSAIWEKLHIIRFSWEFCWQFLTFSQSSTFHWNNSEIYRFLSSDKKCESSGFTISPSSGIEATAFCCLLNSIGNVWISSQLHISALCSYFFLESTSWLLPQQEKKLSFLWKKVCIESLNSRAKPSSLLPIQCCNEV